MAGDVGDRGAGVAVLGDRLGEAGDQPLALVVGDELTRQAVPSRREAGQLGRISSALLDGVSAGFCGHRATIPVGRI